MKKEELIMALQDECLVDRTKVEDFLQALADICVDALGRGEQFSIPEIGTIRSTGSTGRRIVSFASSERIRNQLGTPAPLCIVCKKKDREPPRKKCAECRQAAKKPKALLGDEGARLLGRAKVGAEPAARSWRSSHPRSASPGRLGAGKRRSLPLTVTVLLRQMSGQNLKETTSD
jgi:nucleoid DNA-binding protein